MNRIYPYLFVYMNFRLSIIFLLCGIFFPPWENCYTNPPCDCYNIKNEYYRNIHDSYLKFQKTLRNNDLYCLGYMDHQWQSKYFDRQNSLLKNYVPNPILFNEFYLDMMIDNQRVQLVKEYLLEFWLHFYKDDKTNEKYQTQLQNLQKREMHCLHAYNQTNSIIFENFSNLLRSCLEKHSNPRSIYDFGLLECLNGNYGESINLIRRTIDLANQSGEKELLNSETFKNLGIACIEAMAFEEAVKALTESINKDPDNKEAYFLRAVAYFEQGQFDLAISDYLQSDKRQQINAFSIASAEFRNALLISLASGSLEAVQEFFPSLLSSIYGLGTALWVFAEHPIDSTIEFSNLCYDIGENIVDYCRSLDQKAIEGMADEIKQLYQNFNQLSDSEKGHLIGYTIGKYGIDVFLGAGSVKLIAEVKRLKDANRICNFEALTLSQTNKQNVLSSSLKHCDARQHYIENIKIHWDSQNKHIPSAHNFIPGRSPLDISPQQIELLLKQYAGKGQRIDGNFGLPGYKERVEFNIIIGKYSKEISENQFSMIPTTKGTIRYSKKGAHIVPSKP